MRSDGEGNFAGRTIQPPWLAGSSAAGTSRLQDASNASSMALRTSSPSTVPQRLGAFATALMAIPVEVQDRPS